MGKIGKVAQFISGHFFKVQLRIRGIFAFGRKRYWSTLFTSYLGESKEIERYLLATRGSNLPPYGGCHLM